MKKIFNFKVYLSVGAGLLIGLAPLRALADDFQPLPTVSIPPVSRFNSINDVMTAILTAVIAFGGLWAAIAIIYSGIMYITAGGDKEQAERARKNLTWAVIGLFIIILSGVISYWIRSLPNGTF